MRVQVLPETTAPAALTKHLHVVEDEGGSGLPNAIVSRAAVGARVLLARGVDQEVAEQEARLVVGGDAGAILGPGDPRWGDPAGHTLQNEALALGDNDGLSLRRVDYPGCLCCGAWGGEMEEGDGWEGRWLVGEHPVQWVSSVNGRAHCFPVLGQVNGNAGQEGHSLRVSRTQQSHLAKGLRAFACPLPRTNPKEAQQSQGCIHTPRSTPWGLLLLERSFLSTDNGSHRKPAATALVCAPRAGDVQ